jgi:flavin reductase (DIM6/NTAB) family NADH-FMN oxidoreductase RutF
VQSLSRYFSFSNAFCEAPPIVSFSSGGRKDSQRNAEATGKFVCNLVTRKHSLAMNLTSAPFPTGWTSCSAPVWPRRRRGW